MQIPEKTPLTARPAGERPLEELTPAASAPIGPQAKGDTRDTVSLTEKGREYRNAVRHAQMMPDVRIERVMQLKRQLAEGTYRVEGERVAVNMMDETIENNTVLKHIDLKA